MSDLKPNHFVYQKGSSLDLKMTLKYIHTARQNSQPALFADFFPICHGGSAESRRAYNMSIYVYSTYILHISGPTWDPNGVPWWPKCVV
jgi:hypothetical protein